MSRPYAPVLYTDAALLAEIVEYRAAMKTTRLRGIASISGEGRRIEFTQSGMGDAENELREMYAEARRRGLEIGGDVGAIPVEIG